MQKGFFPIIQILFLAVVVCVISFVVAGKTGGVAVPTVLGILLFLIAINAFRHPGEQGQSTRERLSEMRAALMTNKGGAITLAVIALAGVVIAFLAAGV